MYLDIRTLTVAVAIISFVGCAAFWAMLRLRLPLHGPGWWSAASGCVGVVFSFISLRPGISWLLGILASNVLAVAALCLLWTGLRLFLGRRPPSFLLLALLLLSVTATFAAAYTLSPQGSLGFRIIFISLLLSGIFLIITRELFIGMPARSPGRLLLSAAFLLHAAFLLVRAALTYVFGATLPLLVSGPVTMAAMLVAVAFMALLLAGLGLVVVERLQAEARPVRNLRD
ncbi:hypothetical protein dsx2_1570 [Desulfovibrio sp. X2]|uniref:hypothetical protein n=1 Tax=Desulfovibrio sp. X2 TaxID=941449 RepID=UPI0003589481|nr:hypothetical protein [Desulfovibrio sp. X2]EPR44461.1 hypothetical protein dsx2_1570 [Desulfovibrio sp. X2]